MSIIGQFKRRLLAEVISRLPGPLRRLAGGWRDGRIQSQYANLPLANAFDRIYSSGAWGDNDGRNLYSGGGSTGRYVSEYCQLLHEILTHHRVESLVDLGCGDFNTGRVISTFVSSYTGVDIAQAVVDANNKVHGREGIRFLTADLTCDHLPPADAAVVRQVLQHLGNSEISAALTNVLHSYPLVVVTEHVYVGPGAKPNLDMPHGPGTRVPSKSGVFIDRPPFNVLSRPAGDIPYASGEVLRTWVIEGAGAMTP